MSDYEDLLKDDEISRLKEQIFLLESEKCNLQVKYFLF